MTITVTYKPCKYVVQFSTSMNIDTTYLTIVNSITNMEVLNTYEV